MKKVKLTDEEVAFLKSALKVTYSKLRYTLNSLCSGKLPLMNDKLFKNILRDKDNCYKIITKIKDDDEFSCEICGETLKRDYEGGAPNVCAGCVPPLESEDNDFYD